MQTELVDNRSQYDFPVELQPIFTKLGKPLPRNQAVVRTDTNTPITVVSSIYNLITHKEVLDAVRPFMDKLGAYESSIITEREGARIVATYTFKDKTVELPNTGDKVGLQVHAINSYDKSGSVLIRVGGLVLRCKNGMTAMQDEFVLSYRHSGQHVELGMPDPEIVWDQFKAGAKFWTVLEDIPVDNVLKSKLTSFAVEGHIASDKSLKTAAVLPQVLEAKTAWELYNAFTYAITHESKTRNRTTEILRQDKLNRLFKSAFLPGKEEPTDLN